MSFMLLLRHTLLFILISASLLSSSFASDERKLLERCMIKDRAGASTSSSEKLSENDEEFIVVGRSRILIVKTNDYGNYKPPPALAKPPSKLIPN